jgi:hypothetical protein
MSQTGLFPAHMPVRCQLSDRGSLPVLIEVPDLKMPKRGTRGPHVRSATNRDRGRLHASSPRQRRLRRPVRLSAYALLAVTASLVATALFWTDRRGLAMAASGRESWKGTTERVCLADRDAPGRSLDAHQTAASHAAHVVLLSIESAAPPASAEADVPVVFPGYLLPDDSREEPGHEGS